MDNLEQKEGEPSGEDLARREFSRKLQSGRFQGILDTSFSPKPGTWVKHYILTTDDGLYQGKVVVTEFTRATPSIQLTSVWKVR